MTRSLLTGILILGLILIVSLVTLAIELVDSEVDWEAGVIRVAGIGAPPTGKSEAIGKVLAQRSARADAYRNAVAYLEGVRVDSRTVVKDAVVANDEISNQISGLIQKGRFVEMEYDSDGICTVVLELPLGVKDGLAGILEEMVIETQPTVVQVEPQVQGTETQPTPVQQTVTAGQKYTSIVIDAREFNMEPALYPQVFDSEGHLIYGATSTTFIEGYPTMVAYARSLEKAVELERAGANPLVIKAVSSIRTETENPTDIVLDSFTTKVFKEIDQEANATARRAIIFII